MSLPTEVIVETRTRRWRSPLESIGSSRGARRHPGEQHFPDADREDRVGDRASRQVAGIHFPDLAPSMLASNEVERAAVAFATDTLDQTVIRSNDRAGFVVNSLLVPCLLAAIRMLGRASQQPRPSTREWFSAVRIRWGPSISPASSGSTRSELSLRHVRRVKRALCTHQSRSCCAWWTPDFWAGNRGGLLHVCLRSRLRVPPHSSPTRPTVRA